MLYTDFKGLKISALGFGAMRLPQTDDNPANIDKVRTQELVDDAMASGINYYDTAWGYHDGKSQIVLAECLRKYDRSSYFITNKFPGYDLSNMPKSEEIFEKQLELCKVDYFDFYLIHNVNELNINQYLDPQYGIKDYFVEQVKKGRIKHLGFSLHGEMDVLKRFAEVYGDAMEFCQLQINYLDWEFQHAKEKVDFCREHGWPIIVMEPLRGGKIATMDPDLLSKVNSVGKERTPVRWAFSFLQSIPGIMTTLTGMSEMSQQQEKISYYKDADVLSDKEFGAILEVGREITAKTSIPCTACRYCTPKCPKELDIPTLIARYNELLYNKDKFEFVTTFSMMGTPKDKWMTACIGCGACTKVCPQSIDIPQVMKDFARDLKERSGI